MPKFHGRNPSLVGNVSSQIFAEVTFSRIIPINVSTSDFDFDLYVN